MANTRSTYGTSQPYGPTNRPVEVADSNGLHYAHRVQAGIALLDEILPDWRHYVQPATLAMDDPDFCLEAQIIAGLQAAHGQAVAKSFYATLNKARDVDFTAYGFGLNDLPYASDYEDIKLANTWRVLAFGLPNALANQPD